MEAIGQRELRNDNAEIIRRVEDGESFVVTRRGVPIADLVPHQPVTEGPRRFLPASEFLTLMQSTPDWDVAQFRRDRELLDDLVDDTDRDPWR
jgi:prevent-host-death family protein